MISIVAIAFVSFNYLDESNWLVNANEKEEGYENDDDTQTYNENNKPPGECPTCGQNGISDPMAFQRPSTDQFNFEYNLKYDPLFVKMQKKMPIVFYRLNTEMEYVWVSNSYGEKSIISMINYNSKQIIGKNDYEIYRDRDKFNDKALDAMNWKMSVMDDKITKSKFLPIGTAGNDLYLYTICSPWYSSWGDKLGVRCSAMLFDEKDHLWR